MNMQYIQIKEAIHICLLSLQLYEHAIHNEHAIHPNEGSDTIHMFMFVILTIAV